MTLVKELEVKNIGIKEFRQNISKITDQVVKQKYRFIVHRKDKPVFELHPLDGKELYLDNIRKRINDARKDRALKLEDVLGLLDDRIEQGLRDIKEGRVYTVAQAKKKLKI